MKIEPLGDRILVRIDPLPKFSEGGIALTDYTEDYHKLNTRTGIVEAIGPGLPDEKGVRRPPDVRIGERIYFSRFHEQMGLGYIIPWDKDLVLVSATHDVWAGTVDHGT